MAVVLFSQRAEVKPSQEIISYEQTTSQKTVEVPVVVKEIIDGEPISFQIDRLGINLPVKYGAYDGATGEWTLSDGAAYFAQITKRPNNQSGSTLLYGHNNKTALEQLSGLTLGDIAVVSTNNGHIFTYIYTHDELVSPNSIDVLNYNPDLPTLIVMTCDGIWSQARRLMYFELKEAI